MKHQREMYLAADWPWRVEMRPAPDFYRGLIYGGCLEALMIVAVLLLLALLTACGRGAVGDAVSCVYNCQVMRVALPEQPLRGLK